jgi:hypothetical protein
MDDGFDVKLLENIEISIEIWKIRSNFSEILTRIPIKILSRIEVISTILLQFQEAQLFNNPHKTNFIPITLRPIQNDVTQPDCVQKNKNKFSEQTSSFPLSL